MIQRAFVSTCFILFLFSSQVVAGVVFTSLPNPNVYPMFIILDQQYLDAEFIPAHGSVANLLALMKAGEANVAYLNQQPAQRMARQYGWQLLDATIHKAVYLLSYKPINNRDEINNLKIISAFPGGSPDMMFRAGGFSTTPKFTDLFLAIQLFIKEDFDGLLLPEPHISQVASILREKHRNFFITDMQQLALGQETTNVNAGVARPDIDVQQVTRAFARAASFIRNHPDKAARIVAIAFEKFFGRALPEAAVLDAIATGRLLFASERYH